MIVENDIINMERVVRVYRNLEKSIASQEKHLKFLKNKAENPRNSSFNLHHQDNQGPSHDNFTCTFDALDIIPLIESRLNKLKKSLSCLYVPEFQDLTNIEN